jgi:hypothetical protein
VSVSVLIRDHQGLVRTGIEMIIDPRSPGTVTAHLHLLAGLQLRTGSGW